MNLKVMCRVLCAGERTGWIAPQLASGLVSWSHDKRLASWDYDNIIGHNTSQSARNEACRQFLESDCDYLMMIDNDTKPVHPSTGELLNYVDLAAADLPIVAAPIPVIKGDQWHLNAYAVQGKAWRAMSVNELYKYAQADGAVQAAPVRCDAVGFGAVCIERRVVEYLTYSTFTWENARKRVNCKPGVAVRRTRDEAGGTLVGEDLLFCHRAFSGYYKSYMLPHLQSGHLHTIDFCELHKIKYAYLSPVDLGVTGPFPEMDAYTIELGLAKWLKEEIDKGTYTKILEMGSGLSTLVMGHALTKQDGWLCSIEYDKKYVASTDHYLKNNGLDNVSLCYQEDPAPIVLIEDADLLLVDGPRADGDPKVRRSAEFYFDNLVDGATIVMDDADRAGEASIIKDWVDAGEVSADIKRLGRAAILKKI